MKETEEESRKWKDLTGACNGRINIAKRPNLPNKPNRGSSGDEREVRDKGVNKEETGKIKGLLRHNTQT